MKKYIGHEQQLYGVTEATLTAGKANGMRVLFVRNGSGLEFTVSVDRCADITNLSFKGDNYSYIAPCGHVSPKFYDKDGAGFLKSFTAGFMTTCGFDNVGGSCTDAGEVLPLHGTISNTPCENISHWIQDEKIHIKAIVRDASLFGRQLILEREYVCPLFENVIYMTDVIKNIGPSETPLEVMYHCNMGYPLLSENAIVNIPAEKVDPRNEHSATGLGDCLKMEKPQSGYEEMCFYHKMTGCPEVSIYNPDIKKGLKMSYDSKEMQFFTQWKMMGEYEYVLGLEPGNCNPDGRDVMRKNGTLEFLKPGEEKVHHLKFEFTE